jgi:hypothetical protein
MGARGIGMDGRAHVLMRLVLVLLLLRHGPPPWTVGAQILEATAGRTWGQEAGQRVGMGARGITGRRT